jgi:cytoplasmic iron level regulating protein YaaA (DUF328/UPF0246 family)
MVSRRTFLNMKEGELKDISIIAKEIRGLIHPIL